MSKEPQEIVARGYDVVAEEYVNLEGAIEWPRMRWLRKVLAELPPKSHVLDLGCGSGVPATQEIAREHDVVGVDVSARQIELARRNVPDGEFMQADIQTLEFPPGRWSSHRPRSTRSSRSMSSTISPGSGTRTSSAASTDG